MAYDILIVGGGIMGSSTAYHLVHLEPTLRVAVVERDPTYLRSSTTLSAANLRTVAFSLNENFLIAQRTFKKLETFDADLQADGRPPAIYFRAEGNLFLCDAAGLPEARRIYEKLGLAVSPEETVEAEQVRLVMVPVGESRLELLEPTSESSTIAKFLAKRGEGLHHICLRVPDLRAAVAKLKQDGVRLVSEEIKVGAGGHRYVFVHPSSAGGVLLELVEAP